MLGFLALGVAVASAILNIIGLAIPYWFYQSGQGAKAYSGLWAVCYSDLGKSQCLSYGDIFLTIPDSIKAVRACEILGMLLILGTVLCFIMKLFVVKDKAILPKIGAGLAIVAGIFMIIGCIVFATDKQLDVPAEYLHAGFALCIISGILAFIAAVMGFFIRAEIYTT